MHTLSLVVHGGAGNIRPEIESLARAGAERALATGWAVLQSGGSAIDACEQAILQMEESPVFDAGVGAHLNREGKAQLDAVLMDGVTLKSGAVGAVERIRNPILLARRVLEKSEHSFLVASGAEQFAASQQIRLCDPAELQSPYERQRWAQRLQEEAGVHGTVGAVALDGMGNLCAGTSTGGTFFKHPGRIGDSPIVGCGCFADNESAAVSCTGHGESIMKIIMGKTAADFVVSGFTAQAAADAAVHVLSRRTSGNGGLIVVDRKGRVGVSFSTPHMTWASKTNA